MRTDPMMIVLFLTGIVFVGTAWITGVIPPRRINLLYGYRSQRAMKSQDHWDLAQDVSRRAMYKAGGALILLALLLVPLAPIRNTASDLVLVLVATIGVCIWLFHHTERALVRFESGETTP